MSFTPTHLRPDSGLSFSLFPSNLRFLRKKRGLNQEDVSVLFNKKANTVGNWENGKTEPSIPELLVISGYFGVNLEDLLRSEMRQHPMPTERQLSLWPDAVEKLPGLPTISKEPARSRMPAPAAEPAPATALERSEPSRPAVPVPALEQDRSAEPDQRYDTYSNERSARQPQTGSTTAYRSDAPATGAETVPAGDAIWFMLRELRRVQEGLDRLQSAFDRSRACRPADKSDH